jgi:hypothetical protein
MTESIVLEIILISYFPLAIFTLLFPPLWKYIEKLFERGDTLGIVYVMKVTFILVFYPFVVLGLFLYFCIIAIPPTIEWLFSRP